MTVNGMLKADLHVHSIYSERPSEWILKTLGTRESYTDPELIFRSALERGMDLVTITDHNGLEGALLLKDRYPNQVITGVEVTSYFPESRAKIHVLVYGLRESQWTEINRIRGDLFDLRLYLLREDLPHSIAHATFSVNRRLVYEDLERLILMFDVFEGLNGNCTYIHNHTWQEALSNLTPDHIEALYRKHRIDPMSADPWRKGFTGGSDDHAGLFVATAYTQAPAVDAASFLDNLKDKRSRSAGRHNDFYTLAFSIYKIAYDFMNARGIKLTQPFVNNLNEVLFERKNVSRVGRFTLKRLKTKYQKRNQKTREMLIDTLQEVRQKPGIGLEEKVEKIYEAIAAFSDEFFRAILESVTRDLKKLDVINLLRKVSSSLFGVLMILPFVTTMKHMFQDRRILERLEGAFLPVAAKREKRVLWFTDTITNLNGVSVTLKKIGWLAGRKNKDLTLVSCLLEREINEELPPNLLLLPHMFDFTPKFYDVLTIKIPSVLKSLKIIFELKPEQIIISTPGPVGLIGVLAARLMSVKLKIIYHSDFAKQIGSMIQDEVADSVIDAYQRWFHNLADVILVPTRRYIDILAGQGFDSAKMELFRRGIDLSQYYYRESGRSFLQELTGLETGVILLYAGRVAKDKQLDFLRSLYRELRKEHPDLNLVVAGDGPYLQEYRSGFEADERVFFTGLLDQKILPYVYSGADLFVFPSTADTFGMVVLEAQACGLPAVVSDIGGPQEIIVDGQSGMVAAAGDLEDWRRKLSDLIAEAAQGSPAYRNMRSLAIARVRERFDWEQLLDELFVTKAGDSKPEAIASLSA